MKTPIWINGEYDDIATEQGWGLFDHEDGHATIQRDDEVGRFADDVDAYAFVASLAREDDCVATVALAICDDQQPERLADLAAAAGERAHERVAQARGLLEGDDGRGLARAHWVVEIARVYAPQLLQRMQAAYYGTSAPQARELFKGNHPKVPPMGLDHHTFITTYSDHPVLAAAIVILR